MRGLSLGYRRHVSKRQQRAAVDRLLRRQRGVDVANTDYRPYRIVLGTGDTGERARLIAETAQLPADLARATGALTPVVARHDA